MSDKRVKDYDNKEISNLMSAQFFDFKKSGGIRVDCDPEIQVKDYLTYLYDYADRNKKEQNMQAISDLSVSDLRAFCGAVLNARFQCRNSIPKMTNEKHIRDYIEDALSNLERIKKGWFVNSFRDSMVHCRWQTINAIYVVGIPV